MLCVSCQTLVPAAPTEAKPGAGELWEQGQSAMRQGKAQEAIGFYEQSLAADPQFDRNYLSLAAAYLEVGDEDGACPQLAKYVAAHPENLVIRNHLAELLLRLHHLAEARAEFERFIADAQQQGGPASKNLIHCHSRLMEISEEDADEYGEHLHRGIGLFLLAQERVALPDPEGKLPTEGLLCKAAGELTLARLKRPDEARPCWYLYEVWSRLPMRQPALQCLHAAEAAAPFTYLTPTEQRGLQLACQCQDSRRLLK
jgi:tetratricopeptide (TPR) repeat protein